MYFKVPQHKWPINCHPPFLKNLKVHYLKLNCYNSWMLLNTDLRGWSLLKEDNQQIIAEVKSFQKMKVKKSYISLNLL